MKTKPIESPELRWLKKLFGLEVRPLKKKKKAGIPGISANYRDLPGPRILGRDIPQGRKLSYGKHDALKRNL